MFKQLRFRGFLGVHLALPIGGVIAERNILSFLVKILHLCAFYVKQFIHGYEQHI
jgi:hypothetical protein